MNAGSEEDIEIFEGVGSFKQEVEIQMETVIPHLHFLERFSTYHQMFN